MSHSKRRTKRTFSPNLFVKKFYLAEEDRWITLKVSAAGIRLINKKGLAKALKDAEAKGINIGDKFKTVNNRKIFGVEDLRIKIKEALPEGRISLQFIGEDMLDVITLKLKEQP